LLAGGIAAMPGLISTPGQIWLSVAPVDLRRGVDGLSALVQQTLGQQPCAGSAFVFRNASGNRIKVLLWDGNGVWLCQRRLHQGHFIWPKVGGVRFLHHASAVGMVDCRGRLATFIGATACSFASLIKDISGA
jgi:Transposase and inactivated derivatives